MKNLVQVQDNIWVLTENHEIDIVYSPYDNGFFLHNHNTDEVSGIYDSKEDAYEAYKNGNVDWE